MIFENRTYWDCFNKDELVYLTADSNEYVKELDEQKIYVIGGLVDKNRHKVIFNFKDFCLHLNIF